MKTPMITRTIQTTTVGVLCLDIIHGEPCVRELVLPRAYKDEAAMLKVAKPIIENDPENNGEIKAVHVSYSRVDEVLYGMKETDFIAHAEILPPRANAAE